MDVDDSMPIDSSQSISATVRPQDLFKILISTDNHLGYKEKDSLLGDDSFITFEEVLKIGKDKDVDFILLGGDLFHENRPSSQAYHRCLGLLRKYCMGDKPISVEFLSDPKEVFDHCQVPTVNYEDPNFNISIPVYSIHGNHDDPSGVNRTSALDILSTAGLVNYFGKCTDLTHIVVKPLLLKKGRTKIALYGISHVRDERLFRMFKSNSVEFVKPPEPSTEWFCIFVLHQNRATRPNVKAIPESLIPDFINLVIWGHEHDCRIKPEWNPTKEFHVIQPGSSVATSLSEGEATPKNVGILQVGFSLEQSLEFNLSPVPLKTIRPFVFDAVAISDWPIVGQGKRFQLVQNYVEKYVESELLPKARKLLTGHKDQPSLPLIRLRLEVDHERDEFNTRRFGQMFSTFVANPLDMIILRRIGTTRDRGRAGVPEVGDEEDTVEDTEIKLENLIEHYYQSELVPAKQMLKVMTPTEMSEAVIRFVEKMDKDSIKAIVQHKMQKAFDHAKSNIDANLDVKLCLDNFSELNLSKSKDAQKEEVQSFFDNPTRNDNTWTMDVVNRPSSPVGRTISAASSTLSLTRSSIDDDLDDDEGNDEDVDVSSARGGKGRGRARGAPQTTTGRSGATRGRGSAKGRGSKSSSSNSSFQSVLNFKPLNKTKTRNNTSSSDMLDSPPLKKYKL